MILGCGAAALAATLCLVVCVERHCVVQALAHSAALQLQILSHCHSSFNSFTEHSCLLVAVGLNTAPSLFQQSVFSSSVHLAAAAAAAAESVLPLCRAPV